MARYERNFRVNAEAPLSLDELLDLLDSAGERGSEGWRDAVKLLDGAFAEEGAGLKERKAD